MPGIGIDLSKYKPANEEAKCKLRNELGLMPGIKCIIMIAEFNTNKRHIDLIDAVNSLEDKEIIVLFAGNGALESSMKEYVSKLGIAKQFRFLGRRSDICELLSVADVNVLPSLREGLPRSMMEAMAVGTVNIGSKIRGITDLLSGNCGGLFEARNIIQLAEQIRLALYFHEISSKWRENARIRIKECELSKIIISHEKLYNHLKASNVGH